MQASTAAAKDAMPFVLKWGMAFLALYTVNQIHLPAGLGIPGVNVLNIICLVLWAMHLRTQRANDVKPPLRKRFFLLFAVILFAFMIAQVTLPGDRMEDIALVKAAIFYPIFYFIYFYVVRTEEDIRFLVYAILLVAMIAGLEAIREGLDYGVTSFHPQKRASGPFGVDAKTANRAGIFFAMFICLGLAMVLYHPEPGNRWIRPAAIAAVAIMMGGTFYTFSRQAYLIIGGTAALMMIRRGPAVIVIMLIAALNYDLWLPQAAVDRVAETKHVDDEGVEQVDESTESRWVQWEAGWNMIKAKPWGVGLSRFRDLSESFGGVPHLDAHNHYVLFAAEASPVGLLIHLVLVFSLFFFGRRYYGLATRRKNPLGRALGGGFSFMTVAMILGNIYGSPFANGEVMGLYWALAGLCARHFLILKGASPAAVQDEAPASGSVELDDQGMRKRPRRRVQRPVADVPATARAGSD